jgi:hypothetical protein
MPPMPTMSTRAALNFSCAATSNCGSMIWRA